MFRAVTEKSNTFVVKLDTNIHRKRDVYLRKWEEKRKSILEQKNSEFIFLFFNSEESADRWVSA